MVKISLQISCVFENLEYLKAGDGFSYYLKIRCMSCGESDNIWWESLKLDNFETLFNEFFPIGTLFAKMIGFKKAHAMQREVISWSNASFAPEKIQWTLSKAHKVNKNNLVL